MTVTKKIKRRRVRTVPIELILNLNGELIEFVGRVRERSLGNVTDKKTIWKVAVEHNELRYISLDSHEFTEVQKTMSFK